MPLTVVILIATGAFVSINPFEDVERVTIETHAGSIVLEPIGGGSQYIWDHFVENIQAGTYDDSILHRVATDLGFAVLGRYASDGSPIEGIGLIPAVVEGADRSVERGSVAMAHPPQEYNSISRHADAALVIQFRESSYWATAFAQVVEGMEIFETLHLVNQTIEPDSCTCHEISEPVPRVTLDFRYHAA